MENKLKDINEMSPEEIEEYYIEICNELRINYKTKPFDIIDIPSRKGTRKIMYLNKDGAAQLSNIFKLSVIIIDKIIHKDIMTVTVECKDSTGRIVQDIGSGYIGGAGESLANCYMKIVTKAKRRAILSFCGLGILDETEVESIRKLNYGSKEIEKEIELDIIENDITEDQIKIFDQIIEELKEIYDEEYIEKIKKRFFLIANRYNFNEIIQKIKNNVHRRS